MLRGYSISSASALDFGARVGSVCSSIFATSCSALPSIALSSHSLMLWSRASFVFARARICSSIVFLVTNLVGIVSK